jgi:hypothetical protein
MLQLLLGKQTLRLMMGRGSDMTLLVYPNLSTCSILLLCSLSLGRCMLQHTFLVDSFPN